MDRTDRPANEDFRGKNVTVIGLGIEGEDLARYFLRHGALVTISDRRDRAALGRRAAALEALGARLSLGGNDPADTISADLVCASQGALPTLPAITEARKNGVPVASMTSLFLDRWPGPVAGITGSSGKTTTTSLVDAIFTAAKRDHVLGGNIGIGLMSLLDQDAFDRGGNAPDPFESLGAGANPPSTRLRMHLPRGEGTRARSSRGLPASASDGPWAVLEISHTQLTLVDRSPQVGVLLNVTPNHLDQFSWDEYVELKTHIFSFQSEEDTAVLNADDAVSKELRPRAKGRVFLFSTGGDHGQDGGFVSEGKVHWRRDGVTRTVVSTPEIGLRGAHNAANVAAAVAIAAACDIGPEPAREAILCFRAPPHRIELAGSLAGVDYYDDSIATTPERTLAALRSFEEPVVLLLGGRDKNLPLQELAGEAGRRCRGVICFGEAGPLFAAAVSGRGVPVEVVATLAEAAAAARGLAQPGDVVLLSPAGTSFDAYENFERRGDEFRELVRSSLEEAEA